MKVTVQDIIEHWIKSKTIDSVFYSYDIESDLPIYGRLRHQKVHTASTYSRGFRVLRESNNLDLRGITLEEVRHNGTANRKVKGWKVIVN
jgi:hypothetical protein|tara:strand:- start:34 stop:303 length:270 start_codon:yes stop_codon:yes gene_type:complete